MNCLFYSPWIVKSPFHSSWNVILVIYFFFWNIKCRIYCPWNVKRPIYFPWKVINTPPPPLYRPQRTNINRPIPFVIQSGGSRGGARGGPGPSLIFRPNWGPKGREIFLGDRPPLLMSGSGLLGTPLIWRSGSATDTNFPKHLQNLVKPFKRMLHDTTQ